MKTVVIKKYDSSAEAYIDAEFLRSEGVECEVLENNTFNSLMPGTFHLIALEEYEQKAKEILDR